MLPIEKLRAAGERLAEIDAELCRPEVAADARRSALLLRERAELAPLVEAFARYEGVARRLAEDREALADPELQELAREEIPELEAELQRLRIEIERLLLPRDPNDARDTILEIRAGTGGEEAALFASDLFRMYVRYAERKGWQVEILSSSEASAGGFKEVVAMVRGERVYSHLKYEAGVHRVQRVPATESQGRIHTSTATVAVLPEAEEVDVQIRPEDLEISTAAASGPGGQGVNTTNSAVTIKHLPSGILVRCQEQRSQIQNRARAMQLLRAKLLERERRAADRARRDERRSMVGSGERSEKVRTYNFPQNRVTDHRIGLTLHALERVLDGDLDEVIGALRAHDQAERLHAVRRDDEGVPR